MSRAPLVAVSGATGHVGRLVANGLRDAGISPRLLVRDAGRAPAGFDDIRECAYRDAAASTNALTGVDVLFMVSASESSDRLDEHRTFVRAAVDAGVRHVVYTSFLGAAPDAVFTLARDHWATEQALRDSPIDWTFLRDSFYADFLPLLAGEDGVIRGPAGDGRVGAVARADVARSAVAVLRDPAGHAGSVYDLTGPRALSLDEVARTISKVTGRRTTYLAETVEEAYASRLRFGAPDWQVDAWVSTYTAIAAGELSPVTDDVLRLTGAVPIGLAQLLRQG